MSDLDSAEKNLYAESPNDGNNFTYFDKKVGSSGGILGIGSCTNESCAVD